VEWSGVVKEETEREQDQVLLQYLGWDIYSSLSKFERDVLYDCKLGFQYAEYNELIHGSC
jgi:hypothetical protein